MQPGAENVSSALFYAGHPFAYTTDWMRYAIYRDSSWNPTSQSLQDVVYLDQTDIFGVSTWSGDLSAFRAHGGKLITTHGMMDGLISSDNSARYYNHLSNTMGLPPQDLDNFYRYFRISGQGHCGGGDGAWDIGQRYTVRPARPFDAENNVYLAIVNWVENGTAPEVIRGYRSAGEGGPAYTRKHCKYPARNAYVGPGNYTDENAWRCVTNSVDGLRVQG